jgi:hypothetical protein
MEGKKSEPNVGSIDPAGPKHNDFGGDRESESVVDIAVGG